MNTIPKLLTLLLFCIFLCARALACAAGQPNVVVILLDDIGYGDIAAHGNPVTQTPNLDRLHAESVRLTDFHVDPTCSATRSALMTGKYAHHVGVWSTVAGGNHLRANELTMADAFRANGYRTGMFGKWHLGSNFPYRPMDRGFDEWLGQGDGGVGTTDDHFLNDRVNDYFIHNGQRDIPIKGWNEEVYFNAATDFIRGSKNANKPFFIYLATYAAHHPTTIPDPSWGDKYKPKFDDLAFNFATLEKVDDQIGRLRATLAQEGLDRDTIVIFMTDNGGTHGVKIFNAGMSGKKGQIEDGGHRVPCFVHWPAGGLRHGEDITALNAHFDVLPTLVDICGLKLPRNVDFDGRSFRAQLLDTKAEAPDRTLFVEKQRSLIKSEKWKGAVGMTSRWRLIDNKRLYDIKADPSQTKNVIAAHRDVAATISQQFESYWTKVTPGDRDRPEFIVGDDRQRETFLSSSDWYIAKAPWHHGDVASGLAESGDWMIRAAGAGMYRFEVRRWPREVDAELAGLPVIKKTIDSWTSRGPITNLIYYTKLFKTLPVASVSLTVDGKTQTLPAARGAKEVLFDIQLAPDRSYSVKAELLDSADKLIAGGYYVYCRKISP